MESRNHGKTDGLFRGAFMESGSPLSVGPLADGQVYYDGIVAHSNCSGALDTLDCLRKLPFDTFKAAIDTSPSIFSFQVSNNNLCL
jgi:acetylcholinesterase